jgi:hypothetical protein
MAGSSTSSMRWLMRPCLLHHPCVLHATAVSAAKALARTRQRSLTAPFLPFSHPLPPVAGVLPPPSARPPLPHTVIQIAPALPVGPGGSRYAGRLAAFMDKVKDSLNAYQGKVLVGKDAMGNRYYEMKELDPSQNSELTRREVEYHSNMVRSPPSSRCPRIALVDGSSSSMSLPTFFLPRPLCLSLQDCVPFCPGTNFGVSVTFVHSRARFPLTCGGPSVHYPLTCGLDH